MANDDHTQRFNAAKRRVRVHGQVRKQINEDLFMQALLAIARDLIKPPCDPGQNPDDDP